MCKFRLKEIGKIVVCVREGWDEVVNVVLCIVEIEGWCWSG